MKAITLFILSLILSVSLLAQQKMSFGVTAGPSFVLMSGNEYHNSTKGAISFIGGVYADYHFNENISLYMGLLLERKGGWQEASFEYPNNAIVQGRVRWNYDYITLPILIRLWMGDSKKFFINGGPYAGFLLKKTTVIKSNDQPTDRNENTQYYKTGDFGLTTGLGYNLNKRLSVEVRNSIGLVNISKSPVAGGSVRTNSVGILLAVQL